RTAKANIGIFARFIRVSSWLSPVCRNRITGAPAGQMAHINAHSKGDRIQIVVHTARITELEVEIGCRISLHPSRKSVVLGDIGAAGGLLVLLENTAVRPGPRRRRRQPAENRLLAGGQNVVS